MVAMKGARRRTAKKPEPEVEAKKPEPEAEAKKPEPEVEAKPEGHVIAPGKAITCRRGILGEGEAVTAGDLRGGAEAFATLTKSGYIIARG